MNTTIQQLAEREEKRLSKYVTNSITIQQNQTSTNQSSTAKEVLDESARPKVYVQPQDDLIVYVYEKKGHMSKLLEEKNRSDSQQIDEIVKTNDSTLISTQIQTNEHLASIYLEKDKEKKKHLEAKLNCIDSVITNNELNIKHKESVDSTDLTLETVPKQITEPTIDKLETPTELLRCESEPIAVSKGFSFIGSPRFREKIIGNKNNKLVRSKTGEKNTSAQRTYVKHKERKVPRRYRTISGNEERSVIFERYPDLLNKSKNVYKETIERFKKEHDNSTKHHGATESDLSVKENESKLHHSKKNKSKAHRTNSKTHDAPTNLVHSKSQPNGIVDSKRVLESPKKHQPKIESPKNKKKTPPKAIKKKERRKSSPINPTIITTLPANRSGNTASEIEKLHKKKKIHCSEVEKLLQDIIQIDSAMLELTKKKNDLFEQVKHEQVLITILENQIQEREFQLNKTTPNKDSAWMFS